MYPSFFFLSQKRVKDISLPKSCIVLREFARHITTSISPILLFFYLSSFPPCQLHITNHHLWFVAFSNSASPTFPFSAPGGYPPLSLFADVSVRLEEAKTHRPQMFRALVHNCPLTARSGLCATMEEIQQTAKTQQNPLS